MPKNDLDNEKELVSQLKNGSKEAFGIVYGFYSNALYSKILKMTKDQTVSDDLLQEIFIKIWERRESINQSYSFKGWIYKIAENSIYDHYRKLSQDTKLRSQLIFTFSEIYDQADDYLMDKERERLLNAAIAQLPPQRQMIFKLCKLEGKSYAEAADLLQISSSTVSGQLVKATKSVKDFVFFNSKEFLVFCIAVYLKR